MELRQPSLPLRRRRKPGPKPSPKSGVAHRSRPQLPSRFPVHVTLKVLPRIASLRRRSAFRAISQALGVACDRFGMRVCHFSVQKDHVHLIVEAKDKSCLTKGMRGLTIRMAKALNRMRDQSGNVFRDRYHMRILRTPLEVKRTITYVVNNAVRHGMRFPSRRGWLGVDPYSSAPWVKVFAVRVFKVLLETGSPPVAPSRTWLLTDGWWKKHGYVMPGEVGRKHLREVKVRA